MSLKYGRAEVNSIIDVLDGDHATVEDAAKAVLAAAEEVFEKRAKFVVVGQLSGTRDRQTIPSDDPEAIKLSLGWYSTEGDARSASESLWHSTASGDTYRTWVLPTFHGTPADLHNKAKAKYQAEAAKAAEKRMERVQSSIDARAREADARARELRSRCACGCSALYHMDSPGKYGKCRSHPTCREFNKIMEEVA